MIHDQRKLEYSKLAELATGPDAQYRWFGDLGQSLIHIINLGAGVQSSTMALMAARGIIKPMPVAAIFADTFAEPAKVYRWLEWLETKLPFPVYRVAHHGMPLEDAIRSGTMRNTKMPLRIPLYTLSPEGKKGILRRRCTRDYKIRPIERKVKELMGHKKRSKLPTSPRVCQWIGISLDEIVRAKKSGELWTIHRFPMIEQEMTRADCIEWMESQGYARPPRSACYFCPYHSKDEWRQIKNNPVEWQRAIALDEAVRNSGGMRGELFLSNSCKPLKDMDFNETGLDGKQMDLFADECEGMCGV